MSQHLRSGLQRYLSNGQLELLAKAKIGIAGAGGLGSNLAMILARSGVENLIMVDYDTVDASNLNRQHYWPRDLARPKVEALAESLLALNPHMNLQSVHLRLDEGNIGEIVRQCGIWSEALDNAQTKALFTEKALLAGCRVVAASGICGIGGQSLRRRDLGKLTVVGDFSTSLDCAPPMAPRVIQAAAMMADIVLEWLLQSS